MAQVAVYLLVVLLMLSAAVPSAPQGQDSRGAEHQHMVAVEPKNRYVPVLSENCVFL